jgi:hypothetical protein
MGHQDDGGFGAAVTCCSWLVQPGIQLAAILGSKDYVSSAVIIGLQRTTQVGLTATPPHGRNCSKSKAEAGGSSSTSRTRQAMIILHDHVNVMLGRFRFPILDS